MELKCLVCMCVNEIEMFRICMSVSGIEYLEFACVNGMEFFKVSICVSGIEIFRVCMFV